MKELSIEQKAKRYDEAFERVKELLSRCTDNRDRRTKVYRVEDIESIFPELKESEDERVRKKIIEYMKTGTYNKDYIRYADRYSYEIWRKLMEKFKNIKDYHIGCNEVSDIVLNAIIDTFNWLEKGGDKNKVSKHVEAINEEKVDDANKVEPKDYNSIDPHFGKPADKVEPKFKIGDKIQYSKGCGTIMAIEKIENGEYVFANNMGHTAIELGNKWHLVEQKPADKVEPKFKIKYAGSEYNVLEVKDIAGVTYYGIKDEPNHIDYVQAENCERVDDYSIKESESPFPTKPAKFSEQNSTWSEEDEKGFGDALWCCKQAASIAKNENDMGNAWYAENWLKSLKDRYTWKPSSIQMECLYDAIHHYQTNGYPASKLKELYEQMSNIYKL